ICSVFPGKSAQENNNFGYSDSARRGTPKPQPGALRTDAPYPPSLRSCEKIENSGNSRSQVLDYQEIFFAFRRFFQFFHGFSVTAGRARLSSARRATISKIRRRAGDRRALPPLLLRHC